MHDWGLQPGEIVVDNFAGGGGASTGIGHALGRDPEIAINHDAAAIAVHRANHPHTRHYLTDVWEVDPVSACQGRPVGLAWFSPDCTHFSKAKGAAPVSPRVRSLAWTVVRWARAVRPRVIMLENVEEFRDWGPVKRGPDGLYHPNKRRKARTFQRWISRLCSLGYIVEWRVLCAADYGTPTTRKRLFIIARRDGLPIKWPVPSHTVGSYVSAAEIIDWSVPVPSVFERKKPLAEKTMARIFRGLRRFVLESPSPYIIPKSSSDSHGVSEPLHTVTGRQKLGLATAFLAKYYGKGCGAQSVTDPAPTVTSMNKLSLVSAFLTKYYGTGGQAQALCEPLHTVTSKARFGLVTVHGEPYRIVDIGMRMLQPSELFAAHAFPRDYQIDVPVGDRRITKTDQLRLVGNSVCPPLARALVGANITGDWPAEEPAAQLRLPGA